MLSSCVQCTVIIYFYSIPSNQFTNESIEWNQRKINFILFLFGWIDWWMKWIEEPALQSKKLNFFELTGSWLWVSLGGSPFIHLINSPFNQLYQRQLISSSLQLSWMPKGTEMEKNEILWNEMLPRERSLRLITNNFISLTSLLSFNQMNLSIWFIWWREKEELFEKRRRERKQTKLSIWWIKLILYQ